MGKFSKLWGALLGSLVGLAAAFGLPVEAFTPEIQGVIVSVLSIAGTFIFPANKT